NGVAGADNLVAQGTDQPPGPPVAAAVAQPAALAGVIGQYGLLAFLVAKQRDRGIGRSDTRIGQPGGEGFPLGRGSDLVRRPGKDVTVPLYLAFVGQDPEIAVVAKSHCGNSDPLAVAADIYGRDRLRRQKSALRQERRHLALLKRLADGNGFEVRGSGGWLV